MRCVTAAAARFSVNLKGTPNAISLTVRDTGRGFDPASVSRDGGLGLTSMRERLKLVAGELAHRVAASARHDDRGPRAAPVGFRADTRVSPGPSICV